MPAGLSTSSSDASRTSRVPTACASGAAVVIRIGVMAVCLAWCFRFGLRSAHLCQEALYSGGVRDTVIHAENKLRSVTQSQCLSHPRSKVWCHTLQALEGCLTNSIVTHDAHVYTGLPEIPGHIHSGYRHQTSNARIPGLLREECRNDLANPFCNAL